MDTNSAPYRTADLLRIFQDSAAEPLVLTADRIPIFPDIYQVTDLPKDKTTLDAISETAAAVNATRKVLLPDACHLNFSPETIHVVRKEEFDEKIGGGTGYANTRYGHVYMREGWLRWESQALLAHELLHVAAYTWVDVRTQGRQDDGVRVWPRMTKRRSGMLLIDPSYGTWLPHFHGLNEMVTEMLAVLVRKEIADKTTSLNADHKAKLKYFKTSMPLLAFMDTLFALLRKAGTDIISTGKLLLKDYTNGTDTFIDRLDGVLPGAKERLRRTGQRPDELLAASDDLGLTELSDRIRPHCAT